MCLRRATCKITSLVADSIYVDSHHLSVYCSGSLGHFGVLVFRSRVRTGQHSTRELNKHILTANLIAREDLSVYIQHQMRQTQLTRSWAKPTTAQQNDNEEELAQEEEWAANKKNNVKVTSAAQRWQGARKKTRTWINEWIAQANEEEKKRWNSLFIKNPFTILLRLISLFSFDCAHPFCRLS